MTTPLDEAAIRQAKDIATQVLDCVDREGEWLDEAKAVELIAAALDQVRRAAEDTDAELAAIVIDCKRANGALADAATVPTGNLERGIRALTAERDALRLRVETVERETLKRAAGIARRFIDKGAYANTCLDMARVIESAALASGQPGEEERT